jgi:predicted secreted hydrolase
MALQTAPTDKHSQSFSRFLSGFSFTLSLDGRGKGEGGWRTIFITSLICCFLVFSSFTYQLALPGRKLSFPADHYSHPDFKTEWWYYTGHLETESGKRYGYQVTFFRFGLRDRQKEIKDPPLFSELYMAHFALSDVRQGKFLFRERINRGHGDKAGATTDRYLVWNEDWKVEGE